MTARWFESSQLASQRPRQSIFFSRLKEAESRKVVDVRLSNISQLSGFAKKDDLRFFLHKICGMDYVHAPKFAPTKNILDLYKKKQISWETYENKFLKIMAERHIERINKNDLDGCCLLCSEDTPHFCHRRLVAEYLSNKWGDVEIVHL